MYLENLIKSADKKYKKIPISGISFDSRKVKKRNIFFAIDGNKISGSKFIHEAIFKGASVIISNKKIKQKIPCILVKNVRKSLAEVSSKFFKKKPSKIIAVTGTNGKSSVADFFYQILSLNKIPVASIGTLGIKFKGKLIIKQAPENSKLSLFVNSIVPPKDLIISRDIDKPRPECLSRFLFLSE